MTAIIGYSLGFARDMVPPKMAAYSAALPPIYVKYRGSYLALGGPGRGVDRLGGDWGDRAIMLGRFDDYDAVGRFWWSPEYREAARLRAGAVNVDVCRFSGRLPPDGHEAILVLALVGCRASDPQALLREFAAAAGGSVLAPIDGGAFEVLEGRLDDVLVAVLSFPDKEAALSAWNAGSAALAADCRSLQGFSVGRMPRSG